MRSLIIAAMLLLTTLALSPADATTIDPVEAEACKETQRKVVQGVIVSTDSDCTAQVDIDIQDCVWGGYWDTTQAGPLTVRVYKCSPPHAEMTELGPCPTEKQLGIGTLYLNNNCYAQLDVKFYECIWGGHWDTYGNKVAKVRVYSCDPYPPTTESTDLRTAGPGNPCNTYWYYEETFAGIVTVGTNGNPDCTHVDVGRTQVDARPCPEQSGSTWAVSFETNADCTGWVYVGDSHRVCRALGMRPAGSTVQSVGPLTVGSMNCAPY